MNKATQEMSTLEQRLSRMPAVAEGDFSTRLELQLARQRLRPRPFYLLAWACALLGVLLTLPAAGLADATAKFFAPISARSELTLHALQQTLNTPVSTVTASPELWLVLALLLVLSLALTLLNALPD